MITLNLIGIKIKNYRSIKNLPEDGDFQKIHRFTTIIGKNDSGKSSILNAIRIVLEDEKITKDDFHKNTDDSVEISLIFEVPTDVDDERIQRLYNAINRDIERWFFSGNGENKLIRISKIFEKEEVIRHGSRCRPQTIYEYYNESNRNWVEIRERELKQLINELLPETIYIPAIRDSKKETTLKSGIFRSKLLNPLLETQSESEENSILELKDKLYERIKEKVKLIEELIKDEFKALGNPVEEVSIDPSKLDVDFNPEIRIKDRFVPNSIPLELRGAGINSLFYLAMLRVYAKTGAGKGYIILFEEPELCLHPEAQKKMFNALRKISNEAQVIITTHSTIFIDRSEIDSIWLIRRDENGETKVKTFEVGGELKEIIEEIGAKPSDLLLSNGVIYVEGKTDVIVFSKIAKAICPDWEEYNISIVPLGGSNIKDIAKTLPSNGFANLNPHSILVIDSDGQELDENGYCKPSEDKLKIKNKFEEYGINVYILKKKEIENYIDPEVIKEYFELQEIPEIKPNDDVPQLLKENYDCPRWEKNKSEITPKLFGLMIKRKRIPLEFKEILEKAIIKCGFEPKFNDEYEYV